MTNSSIFLLGNKLPINYDAVIDIFNVSTQPKTDKMQKFMLMLLLDIGRRPLVKDTQ